MNRLEAASRDRQIPVWFGALVVAALWLLARPYVGLRHDGVLYVGQALLHLRPEAMAGDIFFAHGSQDSFSVVSPLLAQLYRTWGVDLVQLVVPTSCHVALMVVAYRLLRALPSAVERWLGLAAIAVLSHVYGGYGIFAFAERFLTARTLAEPFAFAALVLLLYRRYPAAALAIVVAGALHPLMALPAMVVGWLVLCQRDRRWAWAALAAVVPVALAALGKAPFSALFERYDDAWWASVVAINGQVLVSLWRLSDWQIVALDLAVLFAGARLLPEPLRAFARALSWATPLLLAPSALGADLLRDVLLTQLQLWRILWLSHLVSLLVAPALALAAWRRGPTGRLAALAFATTVVSVNARWEAGWVFFLWTASTLALLYRRQALSNAMQRLAMVASGIALALLSTAVAARNVELLRGAHETMSGPTVLLVAFTLPTLTLPAAAATLWGWQRGRAAALAVLVLTATTAAYGAAVWDRRIPWVRYIESALRDEHPFDALIPRRAQVYWHENLDATWLVLKRASYYSAQQGAGLLFNRATAQEHSRRRSAFAALDFQQRVCQTMATLNDETPDASACTPTEEVVDALCRFPAGPDFLIFERRLARGVVAQWTFEAAGEPDRNFYLYDCKHLR